MIRTFDDTVVTVAGPYGEWTLLHFPAHAGDPLISGPQADPDQDGLENLAEYALGANPWLPDNWAAPVSSLEGASLRITWSESMLATDLVIEPQWSEDMVTWHSGGLAVEVLYNGAGWVEKRAALDTREHAHACLRLRVTLP
jgi:hypothetical protein